MSRLKCVASEELNFLLVEWFIIMVTTLNWIINIYPSNHVYLETKTDHFTRFQMWDVVYLELNIGSVCKISNVKSLSTSDDVDDY